MKIVKTRTAMMITRHLYQAEDDGDDSQRNKTQLEMSSCDGGDVLDNDDGDDNNGDEDWSVRQMVMAAA
ncbi:hypothetical protein E2C01_016315 [Portunus trituberculatus]|uniref:Uncharacterized protein n=1 Tax=Portunus trituberculatus TaxID=210409 RepID=A0A5B7DPY2_PORTR|nr:hypothetical protein [Portunus trituberculatus]